MKFQIPFIVYCGLLALNGCVYTNYTQFRENDKAQTPIARVVEFETTEGFFQKPPNCITVLPIKGTGDHIFKETVGATVARHLYQKVNRIIGPSERMTLEKKLAYDLTETNDRKRFSSHVKCQYFAQVTVHEASKTYAIVWAQQSVQLNIKVHGFDQKDLIWRASHRVSRGDGGLPLSPFSLGSAIITAGKANNEPETFPSMLDDGVRRMLVKFPDTRIY